jgi:hypothetical protein
LVCKSLEGLMEIPQPFFKSSFAARLALIDFTVIIPLVVPPF